ncbi:hypothetical protein NC651_009626 [Populus alba x Populus x berolinensis]|nr:hypothetical protein NC651_009626 [Populus alba x Populus x berolinensis]
METMAKLWPHCLFSSAPSSAFLCSCARGLLFFFNRL